jgi:transcription termination factor Rho
MRSDRDPHVSREQVERFVLRAGDRVAAMARAARRSERNPSVVEILEVNGRTPPEEPDRPEEFSRLAALPPAERLPLAGGSASVRMVEVVTPLGKGQRALVEGPGGAGATRLLHDLAASLSDGPVHVVAAVVDARPEELWTWQSSGSELFATTAEDAPADQVRGAVLALERSKRLVEEGTEVVLLIDSLTRLARAHSLAGTRSGADVDSAPVHEAKRLFAAGRRTDRGSLTIVGVARSDGSADADVELREALAQIANVELRLDAELADAGLFPAIDVGSSRTRGEDALMDPDERAHLDALRGPARALEGQEAWRYLAEQLKES